MSLSDDLATLVPAVTGQSPDYQAIQAFLAPSLDTPQGSFDTPAWNGPDSGAAPTAQAFNLADNSVGSGQLGPGAVTGAAFAAGLHPVEIVATLPVVFTNYPAGTPVVLTTDRKMYISSGSAWEIKVDGADILAATVTAAAFAATIVLAGAFLTAVSGARCEMSGVNGFVGYDSLGAVRMQIPNSDDPISFIAAVEATTLTVTGSAAFRAAVSFGKSTVTTLQVGVQAPNAAPTLSLSLPTPLTLATTPGWTVAGRGSYDAVGGTDGATPCYIAVQTDGTSYRVAEWKLADGTLDRTTTLTGGNLTSYRDVVCMGGSWFCLGPVAGVQNTAIYRYLRSTGALTGSTGYDAYTMDGEKLAQDGTYVYILGFTTDWLHLSIFKVTDQLAYVSTVALTLPTVGGAVSVSVNDYTLCDIGDGNGNCHWIDLGWNIGGGVFTHGEIYQFIPAGTVVAGTDFPDNWSRGLFWDGTYFCQSDGGKIYQFPNLTNPNPFWVGYAWLDDVGTTHETAISPRASILVRRRNLDITNAPIPVGGADDPDKVNIYAKPYATDPGAGNLKLQATDALTARTLTSYDSGGAADGGGTAFPGGTGALWRSADGTSWWLRGDGTVGGTSFEDSVTLIATAEGGSANFELIGPLDSWAGGIYVTRAVVTSQVTANNAGNYVSYQLMSLSNAFAAHNLGSPVTSAADTAGYRYSHPIAVGAVVTAGDTSFSLTATRVGAPTGIYAWCQVFYCKIAP
jgi:hypothetical protein